MYRSFFKMMIYMSLIVVLLVKPIYGSHFRGGTISWRPAINNTSVLNSTRTIIIDQRYAWLTSSPASSCSPTTILSYGLIGDNSTNELNCFSSSATCASAGFPTNATTLVPCTDYNNLLNMTYGQSSTSLNLTVQTNGLVIGYGIYPTNLAWMALNMINGTASANISVYLNLTARADNGLINYSPTSSIPLVILVPINSSTSIDIPMSDVDGDIIRCRFAQSSKNESGLIVDECGQICHSAALPNSTQLISNNNTCTLNVSLPSPGYYAVAVQLEDFLGNATEPLSSIPLQFVLQAYYATNSSTNCTIPPEITSIEPDYPSQGSTLYAEVNVPYTATVNAQSGCGSQPNTSIISFITSSPPGMLKTDVPFLVDGPSYAINLIWTPSADQLGMTYTFCAVAVDMNLYMSNQYCFNFIVGPKTTTAAIVVTQPSTPSTTTSTTSTTAIIATNQPIDYTPLALGLGLGIGLPLLCLLSSLALYLMWPCCLRSLQSILPYRFGRHIDMHYQNSQQSNLFDDSQTARSFRGEELKDTAEYRKQYINDNDPSHLPSNQKRHDLSKWNSFHSSSISPFECGPLTTTTTSAFSSSINNLPTDHVEHIASSLPPSNPFPPTGSILVRAFNKQQSSV